MLVSHIVPVVFALIAVIGVVGNSLVLLVVLYGQQMRNTTNILIMVNKHSFKRILAKMAGIRLREPISRC